MARAGTVMKRCKIDGAVARLGLGPRTIRSLATKGKIPGAAKLGDVWTFDVVVLEAFISQRELETWQNGRRPLGDVTGGATRSGVVVKPGVTRNAGHFEQAIQRLRASVAKPT
jgi:hypothetical protein